jgi:hypothetical protein
MYSYESKNEKIETTFTLRNTMSNIFFFFFLINFFPSRSLSIVFTVGISSRVELSLVFMFHFSLFLLFVENFLLITINAEEEAEGKTRTSEVERENYFHYMM